VLKVIVIVPKTSLSCLDSDYDRQTERTASALSKSMVLLEWHQRIG